MTIVHSLQDGQREPSVLTIGTFDGVHLGHQALLKQTIERARALNAQSVVVTFEPIPMMVLRPDKFLGRICTAEEKLELLKATGIDEILVLPFDRALSLESPEEFLEQLNRAFDVREIWVGDDFALGKDREGDVTRLKEIGVRLGIGVCAMERIDAGDIKLSSRGVRSAILAGDVQLAARILGRRFHVEGVVIHNSHFGRTIGFPTANIEPPPDQAPLADGIYATLVHVQGDDQVRWGMTYIGTRPTVNTGARQIETNILDYDADLYGRRLRIEFVQHLRPDENFPSLEELIAQLKRDETLARAALGSATAD